MRAATNTREDCVTSISRHLTDSSSARVGAAAYALWVVGGAQASAALNGMPAARTAQQAIIGYLSDIVAPYPASGAQWLDVYNAALLLGVLRARDASSTLAAKVTPGGNHTFVSAAAAAALSWMDRPECRQMDVSNRSVSATVMATMVTCGVPSFVDTIARFSEYESGFRVSPTLVWERSNTAWATRSAAASDSTLWPKVRVQTTIATDARSATAMLVTSFGPRNGYSYTYLLRHDSNGWRVVGILFTGAA
jgi:hypothetical protein